MSTIVFVLGGFELGIKSSVFYVDEKIVFSKIAKSVFFDKHKGLQVFRVID